MRRHGSRIWLIPTSYVAASVVCAFALPRIEHAYLGSYTFNLSISSTQAYLSAVASGMMALTAIVFSVAFVMVQFSGVAYSQRLVLFFVRDRVLFHTLGVFVATFVYSLWTLAWVDRAGSGTVPLFSTSLVVVMVIISMALFSVLVQRITDLQIGNMLRLIGDKGREVIREMFPRLDDRRDADQVNRSVISSRTVLGPVTQTFKYSGKPRTIAKYDITALVRHAREVGAVIEMLCAVGDTLLEDSVILRIQGGKTGVPEASLLRAVKLETQRTFEQDPKYPIRLLVDIGIKALSPAINDPTTAVQTIDQIEDLLRRLGRRELDTGYAADADGNLRLVFPTPSWDDYLALAFDEIRQYGASSVQVMRRLRSALTGLTDTLTRPARIEAVQHYLKRLDSMIEHSSLDADDRLAARQEDRQGLGLSRTPAEGKEGKAYG